MKKIIVCAATILFPLLSVFSNPLTFSLNPIQNSEKTPAFYVEPLTGFTYGTNFEYVYTNSEEYGGYLNKLSQLDWHFGDWFFGGKIGVSYLNMDFSVYGKGYLSISMGTMEDSDWLNVNDREMKTTYSINESWLNEAFIAGAEFKASAMKNNFFDLRGTFGLEYQHYSYSAGNGYGWYGNASNPMQAWNEEGVLFYKKGQLNGIDYEFNRFLINIGFDLSINLCRYVTLNGGLYVSVFSYFTDIDFHHPSTHYYDQTLSFFSATKQFYNVIFNVTPSFSLKFGYEYFYSALQIGLDAHDDFDGFTAYSGSFGGNEASLMSWTVSGVWKIRKK